MFISLKEQKPIEEGLYVCRCIDSAGNVKYRIDEWKKPTVFQEKYEGIFDGFQLDNTTNLKTNAYQKLNDNYYNHIIQLDKNRRASIDIEGLEFIIQFSNNLYKINSSEYYYCVNVEYDSKIISEKFKIYYDNDKKAFGVFEDDSEILSIINNSKDITLKEYMETIFSNYIIDNLFMPDKRKQ